MARKYLPLIRLGQLKPGVVLVDLDGNQRVVLEVLPGGKILLSHKNSPAIKGKVWDWHTLANFGEKIRQNYQLTEDPFI